MKDVTKIDRIEIYKAYIFAAKLEERLLGAYFKETDENAQFLLNDAHEELDALARRMGYALMPVEEPVLEAAVEHDYLVPEDAA